MSKDFNVSYNAGGSLNKVKNVENVDNVNRVDNIRNFPILNTPFNEMICLNIPAKKGIYEDTYVMPNKNAEILAITVTCSGYGEDDCYDLFVGQNQWFKNWYCCEVKEGLFLGTSTFVYKAKPLTEINIKFKNNSGTAKKVWLGVRMLVEDSNAE